jgi:uncharacterized protein (TIGR00299 family) protein
MKTLYFDIIGGTSGDMTVASLLDLGADFLKLKRELKKIRIRGYSLKKSFVVRGHLKALKFDCNVVRKKNYTYRQILSLIASSRLSRKTKERIRRVYDVLCKAEVKVHGHRHKAIAFDQLGDIDSIVDIAAACICFEALGIDEIVYSVLPLGHGLAPATFELLEGKDIYFTGQLFENVTPTGMALLRALGRQSDALVRRVLRPERVGYGAGSCDPSGVTNVLRAVVSSELSFGTEIDEVSCCEANIDDMNPQIFEYVFDKLFEAGALDVFLTPVLMKKTRPGFLLTVLSKHENLGKISDIVLSETTSIGVRSYVAQRVKRAREIRRIAFEGHKVRVKVTDRKDGARISAEYEDCKVIALKKRMPLLKVMEEVRRKAQHQWHSQD